MPEIYPRSNECFFKFACKGNSLADMNGLFFVFFGFIFSTVGIMCCCSNQTFLDKM